MKSKNDLPIENYNVFKQALIESISTFTTDDSTIDLEEIVKSDNPLIILKSKMSIYLHYLIIIFVKYAQL